MLVPVVFCWVVQCLLHDMSCPESSGCHLLSSIGKLTMLVRQSAYAASRAKVKMVVQATCVCNMSESHSTGP